MTEVVDEWVAYVGPFRFPAGDAASRRVAGIAAAIAATGRSVVIANGGSGSEDNHFTDDSLAHTHHVEVEDSPGYLTSRTAKARLLLIDWGKATVAWLDAQATRPSHVILYGGLATFAIRIRRWCAQNDVAFLVDVVEWYSPRQLTGRMPGLLSASSEVAMRWLYPRADGLICISSYLGEWYSRRVPHVAVVPPTIVDLPEEPLESIRAEGSLRLLYFGNAGRKDRVDLMVEAVASLRKQGSDVTLTLVGSLPARINNRDGICIQGRVPQASIPSLLRHHDFSVIVRDPARFTRAGFPTKFVESLAHGTPVIANATGDLGKHMAHKIDGIVVQGNSREELVSAISVALSMSAAERHGMRLAAHARAARDFHFSCYVPSLRQLLDGTTT